MDNKNNESADQDKLKRDMDEALSKVNDPILKQICSESFTKMFAVAGKQPDADDINDPTVLKKKIISAPLKEEQIIFSFLPHEMAKVSIFFPMSGKELKAGQRLIDRFSQETGWGKIVVEGVKLAIYEEDIFLALLKIAKDNFTKDKKEFLLKTSVKEIAKLLYGTTGYSTTKTADMLVRTLKNFQLVRFEITLFDKNSEDGKRKRADGMVGSVGNIVESFYYNPDNHEFSIFFNPHFCFFFLGSMLTNINFTLRRQLKKDGSKALLRFLAAHRNPSRMHILTVLNAINFNTNQPMFKLRQLFKSFLKELKDHHVLGPKTRIHDDDTVTFDILAPHKVLDNKE